ncbi:MAG: AAA family ATPase [Dehalococcoidia bacterium]
MIVKNYKSIAVTSVDLEAFTVLVGANGSGKSNFVDALRFVSDCLNTSISLALQNRGGINAVRRHSRGHPTHFGIRLVIELERQGFADYSFEIAARQQGRFEVKGERCIVQTALFREEAKYQVQDGKFTQELPGIRPKIETDRLALSVVSAVEEFRPVYDFLTSMRFYALAPDQIRQLQEPDAGEVLNRYGSNAAAVLREIQKRKPDSYERLCHLLSKVVPGTRRAEYLSLGQKETLRFKQDVGDKDPWNFNALNMSDGTLRVLGILLAVYQASAATFIAIEEPEATIHPAALDVIIDILKDGTARSQILVTTHSPDVLDNRKIQDSELRLVTSQKGRTIIAPLAEVTRKVIRDRLYSAGELLRMEELRPDESVTQAQQPSLFGAPERSLAK